LPPQQNKFKNNDWSAIVTLFDELNKNVEKVRRRGRALHAAGGRSHAEAAAAAQKPAGVRECKCMEAAPPPLRIRF
jgi:hypothetical protein